MEPPEGQRTPAGLPLPGHLIGRSAPAGNWFERGVSRVRGFFQGTFRDGEQGYLLILAVLVGLVMGCVSSLFRLLINASHHVFFEASQRDEFLFWDISGGPGQLAVRALLPATGGLIVGLVIYRMMKLTGGHGVPSVMRAVATGKTNLPPKMAIKSSSSVITISSGGSCGPEGPIIEIGSVVGSSIGRAMQVSKERIGTLIGCGAASGVAAFFNAPFGGVFLAIELLLRDFAVRTFGPIMIAAVVAHVTSEAIFPHAPLFPEVAGDVMETIQPTGWMLFMFAAMGVLCGLFGVLLVIGLYKAHDLFHSLKVPLWVKPAIGGLGVGLIGLMYPEIIGEGYNFVSMHILEHFRAHDPERLTLTVAGSLVLVAVLKILATSLTLGSGGTGGTFAPAMVTGAMVGAGWGVLCNWAFPTLSPSVPVFALVGMAGMVCSSLGVPIAGMLIIYEIAGGDYRLVLPLMMCVATSVLVSNSLRQGSVYTLSLLRDGFDVEKAIHRGRDPLLQVPVRDIMRRNFTRLRPGDNLAAVLDAFTISDDDAFAVVDNGDTLVGIISANDLRGVLNMGDLGAAIIAADAADTNPQVLYPDSPATEAISIFGSTEATGIPILESGESRKIIGLVGRVDVLTAYRKASGEDGPSPGG